MNRISVLSATIVIFLLTQGTSLAGGVQRRSESMNEPPLVSAIQLVAAPERWDGQLVRVVGFCKLENGTQAIFVNREDYTAYLTKNGIRLKLDPDTRQAYKQIADGYVIVEGVFSKPAQGSNELYAGVFRDIVRFERYPSRDEMTDRIKNPVRPR